MEPQWLSAVQRGVDRNPVILDRGAGEIDDGLVVRALAQESVDHLGLAGWIGEQRGVLPRHHRDIAHRFEPRVLPDRPGIAEQVAGLAFAGRIDQHAIVGQIEITRHHLVERCEKRQWIGQAAQIAGGVVRLCRPVDACPAEIGHPGRPDLNLCVRLDGKYRDANAAFAVARPVPVDAGNRRA